MVKKVFILDDDELIRTTLTYFLKQEGYQVESFSQPDRCPVYFSTNCICQANSHCADIIITDINMPGQGGIDFIENQIRKGCKVTHIAVMSGDWASQEMKKAKNLGCKTFSKPFSILAMKEWLDSLKFESSSSEMQIDIHLQAGIEPVRKRKLYRTVPRKPSENKSR